ncbi:MAG: nucleotide exchange factor GrpE [Erysipelotrichales bacterium]|nr:nucleotide exchange factor GrpE [Erysipelotrichales bacterium]
MNKNKKKESNEEKPKNEEEKVANSECEVEPQYVPKEDYDKMQEQFNKALNTAAYYENQGKYYKSEYEKSIKYRSQSIVEELLRVLDGFQLAFKMDAPNQEAINYRTGFEFVYKLLLEALENEGVVQIVPKVGEKYDSKIHHAVEIIDTQDDSKNNTVIEILLNGYMLKDRLIRPATVKVFAKKEEKEEIENIEDSHESEEMKN